MIKISSYERYDSLRQRGQSSLVRTVIIFVVKKYDSLVQIKMANVFERISEMPAAGCCVEGPNHVLGEMIVVGNDVAISSG